jgi:hypothetical protein
MMMTARAALEHPPNRRQGPRDVAMRRRPVIPRRRRRLMFQMMLTTCFAGILCFSEAPEISYLSAERCLQQGAILSGMTRVSLDLAHMAQTTKIECEGIDGSKQTVSFDNGNPSTLDAKDALTLPTSR